VYYAIKITTRGISLVAVRVAAAAEWQYCHWALRHRSARLLSEWKNFHCRHDLDWNGFHLKPKTRTAPLSVV